MPAVHNLGEAAPRDIRSDATWQIELAPDGGVRRISFADFHRDADGLARGLLARGRERGDAVGILAANSAEYLVAYFGIMRAGLVAVPINYKVPGPTVEHILSDANVRLVLVDQEYGHLAGDLPKLPLDRAEIWQGFLDHGPFDPIAMKDDEYATILYTSGSTGMPKGVPLTHGGYIWTAVKMLEAAPPMANKRVLVAAPLYHMNGLILSTLTAMAGGTTVLMRRFSARGYLKAAAEHRCHMLTSVPTMIALAVREPELIATLDLSAVESVIMGSAPSTEALFERAAEIFPNASISNSWGTTESGPVAFGPHPDGLATPRLSLGYPVAHAETKFVDGPDDNEGVLWVRNKAVMPGYLNRPEETMKCIRDGWYDSGDIMRRDDNGFVFFVGRADDMFVCGGENIYPAEVERLLEQHPAVAQAAVIPIADEIKQFVPVAYVVAKPGVSASIEDIKQFTLDNGPAYQHPRFVAVVRELPLAGTNKIDRRALLERASGEFSRYTTRR